MNREFPSVLIRASAGTGKTFQLSNRYLQLLNSGVPPEQILAVTFTRMAAGEIMDRVMHRLAEAAGDTEKCRQLGGFLDDHSFDPPRCLDLLEQLTKQLHRMRIETLDSYFSKLARSFSLELGKPPGWTITEEIKDQHLKTEAIRIVLRQNAKDINPLMNLLFKGEADRNISQQLFDTISSAYLLYRCSNEKAWKDFPEPEILAVPDLLAAIKDLSTIELPTHKTIQSTYAKELEAAQEMIWDEFVGGGIASRVNQGVTEYCRKEIPEEAVKIYQRLISHSRGVTLDQISKQTAATYELLDRFDEQYEQLKNKHRAYRFDDIQFDLGKYVDVAEIHGNSFRMDSTISHLLVDEFQDTSLTQWEVLRPLAQKLTQTNDQKSFFFMGGPTSFFCVGDTKQAIYGWRGGQAGIFDELPRELANLEEQNLNKSYRSSQVVIDIVNQVFTKLGDRSRLERAENAIKAWSAAFPKHETQRDDLPGFFRLQISDGKQENETGSESNLRYTANYIKQLHDECPDRTFGILVRRNQAAARIVSLLRGLGLRASEERGGNYLSDSAAVQLIMSALKLADHPGDSSARFHVAENVLGKHLGYTDFRNSNLAIETADDIRTQLATFGYGYVINEWADFLIPHCTDRQRRRLQQLVQMAFSYQSMATLRPSDFVAFIDSKKIPDPVPSNIRVMTIHQAKGLEFDVVVLPDLDSPIVSQQDNCVAGRPNPTAPIDRVCRRVKRQIVAVMPEDLQQLFSNATDEDVHEELCVLYVAMTRAVHALHIVTQPGGNWTTQISSLVRSTLSDAKSANASEVYHEYGDPNWYETADKPLAKDEEKTRIIKLESAIKFRNRDESPGQHAWQTLSRKPQRSPSTLPGKERIGASSLLSLNNIENKARGSLYHFWFEQIQWLDDSIPSESGLVDSASGINLGQLDLESEAKTFLSQFSNREFAKNFHRSFYADLSQIGLDPISEGDCVLQVQNERPFACETDTGFLTGSIDRLVLILSGNNLVAADIVDFKTDILDPHSEQSINRKVDAYTDQMEAYRSAVSTIFQLDPSSVAARIVFSNYGIARNVRPGTMVSE